MFFRILFMIFVLKAELFANKKKTAIRGHNSVHKESYRRKILHFMGFIGSFHISEAWSKKIGIQYEYSLYIGLFYSNPMFPLFLNFQKKVLVPDNGPYI